MFTNLSGPAKAVVISQLQGDELANYQRENGIDPKKEWKPYTEYGVADLGLLQEWGIGSQMDPEMLLILKQMLLAEQEQETVDQVPYKKDSKEASYWQSRYEAAGGAVAERRAEESSVLWVDEAQNPKVEFHKPVINQEQIQL